MFPQSSYNTPHGHQFGRDAVEFEDGAINPNLWDEALSEQSFEETHEDDAYRIEQEQEYARSIALASQAEAQAQAVAVPIERESNHELNVMNAHLLADVGKHDQFYRDHVKSEEPQEDTTAKAFNFNMFKSKDQKHASKVARMSERQLVQAESEIGRTIFGPVPKDGRREFFNLDMDTWIWHEEWTDAEKKKNFRTTRYEVRGDEVIKSQDGEKRTYVVDTELQNLVTAARVYHDRVARAIYHRDPATGRKLVDIL